MSYIGRTFTTRDDYGRQDTRLVINECADGYIVWQTRNDNFDVCLISKEEFHRFRELAESPEQRELVI